VQRIFSSRKVVKALGARGLLPDSIVTLTPAPPPRARDAFVDRRAARLRRSPRAEPAGAASGRRAAEARRGVSCGDPLAFEPEVIACHTRLMDARRQVLRWLASAPLGAVLYYYRAVAGAAPALGQPYDGELVDTPGPGARPVLLRGGFARLGARLEAGARRAVFSIANDNDRYVAIVELTAVPRRMSFLTLPGGVVRAESWGTGFGGKSTGSASFHVDRAIGDELAKLWAVPRRDRTPLGAGLTGRFRAKASPFRAGAPMPIGLEVRNDGAAPVGFSVGGRQRGPRDNRFDFVVEQGGKPLPRTEAVDFGGPMAYREIKPGETVELAADLASWAKFDPPAGYRTPGAYRVHCSYKAELVPGTELASWPDRGHETWDLTLTGDLDVTVT
jgi:hypothetical protein